VALFGAAATGLLVAHELDYRLVVPDPAHRHDLLLRSGHGWLQHGLMLGLVAGLLAVFTAIALGATRAKGSEGMTRVAPRLAMIQAGGFVLLEAVERILVGAPPDDRLLLITAVGIAVQVVTALVGARVLRLIERAAHRVACLFAPPPGDPHASTGFAPVVIDAVPRARQLSGARGVRGPPVPVC